MVCSIFHRVHAVNAVLRVPAQFSTCVSFTFTEKTGHQEIQQARVQQNGKMRWDNNPTRHHSWYLQQNIQRSLKLAFFFFFKLKIIIKEHNGQKFSSCSGSFLHFALSKNYEIAPSTSCHCVEPQNITETHRILIQTILEQHKDYFIPSELSSKFHLSLGV